MEEKRTDAMLLAHLSTFASFKTLSVKSSILSIYFFILVSETPTCKEKMNLNLIPPQFFFSSVEHAMNASAYHASHAS